MNVTVFLHKTEWISMLKLFNLGGIKNDITVKTDIFKYLESKMKLNNQISLNERMQKAFRISESQFLFYSFFHKIFLAQYIPTPSQWSKHNKSILEIYLISSYIRDRCGFVMSYLITPESITVMCVRVSWISKEFI